VVPRPLAASELPMSRPPRVVLVLTHTDWVHVVLAGSGASEET
jgi:hypothetical protein